MPILPQFSRYLVDIDPVLPRPKHPHSTGSQDSSYKLKNWFWVWPQWRLGAVYIWSWTVRSIFVWDLSGMNRTQDIVTKLKELKISASSFQLLLKSTNYSIPQKILGVLETSKKINYLCIFVYFKMSFLLNFSTFQAAPEIGFGNQDASSKSGFSCWLYELVVPFGRKKNYILIFTLFVREFLCAGLHLL